MPVRQEVVQNLTGEWRTGLCEAPCEAPLSFLYGLCCPCCMASQQRLKILDVIGEPYVCCGGMFPCGPLGEPQDRSCIWAEACCCTGLAISGNRFLIQTRLDRQNTACDDCLLWATCLAPYVVCLCECAGVDVPNEIENCVDCMQITVASCMLAQQQVEIDYVEKHGFMGASPAVIAMLPPMQQQMIGQAKPMGAGVGAGVAMAAPPMAAMCAPAAVGAAGAGGPAGGFMATLAPNGLPWQAYCYGQPVHIDPMTGFLQGPWGECLAWAKVFEVQSPGWASDPAYQASGPCGQVIEAVVAASPEHMMGQAIQSCERLELACDQAVQAGAPLPVIGQRA